MLDQTSRHVSGTHSQSELAAQRVRSKVLWELSVGKRTPLGKAKLGNPQWAPGYRIRAIEGPQPTRPVCHESLAAKNLVKLLVIQKDRKNG